MQPIDSPHTNINASDHCDVLVVGGGINGAGIARDLAGRGWKVVLAERDDLASHTSSSSTKLIHGGLRYLEHRAFGLVRKALREREVLLRSAPHIMRPLRFVLPHMPAMRPAWVIRLGLFLYDHLARRELLPASQGMDLTVHPAGHVLQPRFHQGFAYSDGWVDDARLVVLAARDAADRGATVLTRTACVSAQASAGGWHAVLRDEAGTQRAVQARLVVNATGPWADRFLRQEVKSAETGEAVPPRLRLVKGSHIVIARRWSQEHAYLFQNDDGRILFAIPYEQDFMLVGTTDVEVDGEPGSAAVEPAEIAYLCAQANRFLREPIAPADVVWTYAGVRPLLDDGSGKASALPRDYQLQYSRRAGAPLVSVMGGKITTFRKLAEEAADGAGEMLGQRRARWTEAAYLPGGDLSSWIEPTRRPDADFGCFLEALGQRHGWLPETIARRYARAYGSRVEQLINGARALQDLGREVSPGLYEAELHYLRDAEWATRADDVLWRRTKLGLHYTEPQRQAVCAWMGEC